ncbi:hypothetical protein YC2023_087036 [Brassica napus]
MRTILEVMVVVQWDILKAITLVELRKMVDSNEQSSDKHMWAKELVETRANQVHVVVVWTRGMSFFGNQREYWLRIRSADRIVVEFISACVSQTLLKPASAFGLYKDIWRNNHPREYKEKATHYTLKLLCCPQARSYVFGCLKDELFFTHKSLQGHRCLNVPLAFDRCRDTESFVQYCLYRGKEFVDIPSWNCDVGGLGLTSCSLAVSAHQSRFHTIMLPINQVSSAYVLPLKVE